MSTPPRWLREHRRVANAAASPESLAAEVARLVEQKHHRPLEIRPVDWETFGDPTLSDEEWEAFVSAIEEIKGRPLLR